MRRSGLRPAFFFEGGLRLTEGETLSFARSENYDWARMGRFFQISKLEGLGDIHLDKVHIPYWAEGKDRRVGVEFSLGDDPQRGKREVVYVNHPLKHKGFEFYHDKDGYSPLIVLRSAIGRVLYGAYVPLQSILQEDRTYLYRSGTAVAPGSFDFPQDPGRSPVFKLQTAYYPDKEKKRAGEVLFQVWRYDPSPWAEPEKEKELFKGKAALGEPVRAGDFFLSMDEVRYWTSLKVIHRPGQPIIFGSFWLGLGGIILNIILKNAKRRREAGQYEQ